MVYDGYIGTRGVEITKGTEMTTHQINYFTKLRQIEEIIGERTVFHGSCAVNCPKYEMTNGYLFVESI